MQLPQPALRTPPGGGEEQSCPCLQRIPGLAVGLVEAHCGLHLAPCWGLAIPGLKRRLPLKFEGGIYSRPKPIGMNLVGTIPVMRCSHIPPTVVLGSHLAGLAKQCLGN